MADYKKSDTIIDKTIYTAPIPSYEDETLEPCGAPDEAEK